VGGSWWRGVCRWLQQWSGPITAHVFVSREMTDDQPQAKPGLVLAEKRRVAFSQRNKCFTRTNSRSAPHKCPRSSPNGQLAAHAPEKDRLASFDLHLAGHHSLPSYTLSP
jgi:hypothetical protein